MKKPIKTPSLLPPNTEPIGSADCNLDVAQYHCELAIKHGFKLYIDPEFIFDGRTGEFYAVATNWETPIARRIVVKDIRAFFREQRGRRVASLI